MNHNRRISLFQHWTRSYFIILLLGLVVAAACTVVWLKYATKEERLEKFETLAQEFALNVTDENGHLLDDRGMDQAIKRAERMLQMNGLSQALVVDSARNQVFPIERQPDDIRRRQGAAQGPSPDHSPPRQPGPLDSLESPVKPKPLGPELLNLLRETPKTSTLTKSVRTLDSVGKTYFIQVPVMHNGNPIGEVYLSMSDRAASQLTIPYAMLISLLLTALLLGWGTIFLLTKRLVRPIQEVAKVANMMKAGHYDVKLDIRIKEKEVYEMMSAIQTMAEKLKHLESLRTLLLAGVTHELKTPIASIRGLVQAVKDNIVHGEEKEEFLTLSLQETHRLQRMVEDLLDFNGFATGALRASLEEIALPGFMSEVVHQWQMASEKHNKLKLYVQNVGCPKSVKSDPVRLQQILVNLLNNASHAIQDSGSIRLRLYTFNERLAGIDVIDYGKGIPEEEQSYIFERFYRGKAKKYEEKGLGLGLPFSLMLAKAQGGELFLKESSPEGTTFTLTLPYK